ncbi:MAG: GNAT family N-acetyltransferase [Nitrococcus mobilis]|nr:GNAT family N-acetyltransferase [Nitrococcus mobilis]
MSGGGNQLREIGFPIRLGEWTLATPLRTLVVRRAGVLDREHPPEWPRLSDLPNGADGFMLVRRAETASRRRRPVSFADGVLRWTIQRGPRHFVRLDGTFDEYLQRFSPKTRSGLRRKLRRIERDSGAKVSFRIYSESEFPAFHQTAIDVSRATYQEIMFDAGLPADEASKRKMADAMAAGRAEGYVLFIGDDPVAYLYCPIRNGVAEYEFVGYRPEFARLSPGTVLLMRVLESLFARADVRAFDFTEGAGKGSHKSFYATDSEEFETVVLLRPTVSNVALILFRETIGGISGTLGYALDTLGVKMRVRGWMRKVRGVPA